MSTLTKFTGGMQLRNKAIYSRAGLQSRSTWMGWSYRSTGILRNSARTNVQSSTERGELPYSGTGVGWGGKGADLWEGPRGLVGITRADGVLGCVNRSLSEEKDHLICSAPIRHHLNVTSSFRPPTQKRY